MSAIAEPNILPNRINPRIFLLSLGMFALGTDAFVIAGVLPAISNDLNITPSLAGQLVTAFALAYGFGAPFMAALTGRWPRNKVLTGALGLFCLADIGAAFAPSFAILILMRVLTGCLASTYSPLAYSTGIAMAPPEKRGQALAFVVVGFTTATAFGSPMGTWVAEHLHWRLSFGLVALLAFLALAAIVLCGLPPAHTTRTMPLNTRLAPMVQPRVVLALLPSLIWNVGSQMLYTYIALLLHTTMHVTEISGLLVGYGIGGVIGNWSGGILVDRFGVKRPIIITLIVLGIIEAALPYLTTTLLGGSIALFIWALIGSTIFIPQQHRMLNMAPEHASVILALNNSTFYLGIGCGAVLGGLALRVVDVTQLAWIATACSALALVLFLFSTRLRTSRISVQVPSTEPS